jgi:hypothetical protein
MGERWTDARALVIAYSGSAEGASAVGPAVRALRASLPETRLLLLWPASVRVPPLVAAVVDSRIECPMPEAAGKTATLKAVRGMTGRAVRELRAAAPTGAVFFSEAGCTACVPAYLCCLAGIARRAGFAAEVAGGLLTNPLEPPPAATPAPERHLFLLESLGLAGGPKPFMGSDDAAGSTRLTGADGVALRFGTAWPGP